MPWVAIMHPNNEVVPAYRNELFYRCLNVRSRANETTVNVIVALSPASVGPKHLICSQSIWNPLFRINGH
jgi:hypothetical protein